MVARYPTRHGTSRTDWGSRSCEYVCGQALSGRRYPTRHLVSPLLSSRRGVISRGPAPHGHPWARFVLRYRPRRWAEVAEFVLAPMGAAAREEITRHAAHSDPRCAHRHVQPNSDISSRIRRFARSRNNACSEYEPAAATSTCSARCTTSAMTDRGRAARATLSVTRSRRSCRHAAHDVFGRAKSDKAYWARPSGTARTETGPNGNSINGLV